MGVKSARQRKDEIRKETASNKPIEVAEESAEIMTIVISKASDETYNVSFNDETKVAYLKSQKQIMAAISIEISELLK